VKKKIIPIFNQHITGARYTRVRVILDKYGSSTQAPIIIGVLQ